MRLGEGNGDAVMNGALLKRAYEIIEGKVKGVPEEERQLLHFRLTMDIYEKLSGLPLMWMPPRLKKATTWVGIAWVVWMTAEHLGFRLSLMDVINFFGKFIA